MFTVFWNLAALAAGTDTFQQVSSGNILPPKAYRDAFKTPVSSTSDTPLDNASFVGAPQNEENGGVDLQGVNLNMYAATDVDVGSQSTITEDSVSSLSSSVTAQAVVDGMDLQQCVQQIHFANDQYTSFNNALSGTSMEVKQASLKLSQIDIVIHNILSDEDNFKSEIARLDELYNTLAVRGNALGKWMSDEKGVRDNLEELYRNMVAKNTDEESRLALLRTNMKSAMTRLTQVQEQTAVVLSSVADAQVAMYDWAANVTLAVNTHTTKLNSVCVYAKNIFACIFIAPPESSVPHRPDRRRGPRDAQHGPADHLDLSQFGGDEFGLRGCQRAEPRGVRFGHQHPRRRHHGHPLPRSGWMRINFLRPHIEEKCMQVSFPNLR